MSHQLGNLTASVSSPKTYQQLMGRHKDQYCVSSSLVTKINHCGGGKDC